MSGRGIRVDSSAPQQRGIVVSIDELLEVIGGANGTPVLVITTSDGRLSARAVSGVQINVVPSNQHVNSSTENSFLALRAWLLLVTSLVATVTFTAGLTPPGGFWAEDKDGPDGHVAGTPIMRDKFFRRYRMYQSSNTGAFLLSLMIIGALVTNTDKEYYSSKNFPIMVCACFLMFELSFISGTWDGQLWGIALIISFVGVIGCMSMSLFPAWYRSRTTGDEPSDNS